VRKHDHTYFDSIVQRYSGPLGLSKRAKNLDIFLSAYEALSKNYRSEYIYKNALLNKQLLGKYSLNTATVLNEFRVGFAKADLVLLNGTSVAYEIKTELDSRERLSHPTFYYQKVFANTVIVTHHTLVKKYTDILPNNIGIVALSKRNQLSVVRESKENLSQFDHETVMRSLRTGEYTHIIKEYFGRVPDVPNTLFFKESLSLFKKIPKEDVHKMMVTVLKNRTVTQQEKFLSDKTPEALKHICFCLDLNAKEYEYLYSFLNQKVCTYLI